MSDCKRIVFIQSYPIYHDYYSENYWLLLENRDKWIPAKLNSLEFEVELWVIGKTSYTYTYHRKNYKPLKIKIFKADSFSGKTKKHRSKALLEHAKNHYVDLYIIKGLDGGVGNSLLKYHIIPMKINFGFIVGGQWYSKFNRYARFILYESNRQLNDLEKRRTFNFFTIKCPKKYIFLPKSVDTNLFKPISGIKKKYDIICAGRLISYYKKYDALINISKYLKVGFIGSGDIFEKIKYIVPSIDWVGFVQNDDMPEYYNLGKCLFYPSQKDYFPRVIAEAASCGLPVIGFSSVFESDVISDNYGMLVSKRHYVSEIVELVNDDVRLESLSVRARKHAIENWGETSGIPSILKAIKLCRE